MAGIPSKVAKMTRGLVALMPDKSGSQTSDNMYDMTVTVFQAQRCDFQPEEQRVFQKDRRKRLERRSESHTTLGGMLLQGKYRHVPVQLRHWLSYLGQSLQPSQLGLVALICHYSHH